MNKHGQCKKPSSNMYNECINKTKMYIRKVFEVF